MNLAKAGREDFEARLETRFKASAGEGPAFDLELIEVAPMGATPGPTGRQAFSLVLRGPQVARPTQQVYRLEDDAGEVLDLFLVPIGPDDEGMKYEAVFT